MHGLSTSTTSRQGLPELTRCSCNVARNALSQPTASGLLQCTLPATTDRRRGVPRTQTHLQQCVFQLDVPVNHTPPVAVVQPNDQLLKEPAAGCFFQAHCTLHIAASGKDTCVTHIGSTTKTSAVRRAGKVAHNTSRHGPSSLKKVTMLPHCGVSCVQHPTPEPECSFCNPPGQPQLPTRRAALFAIARYSCVPHNHSPMPLCN
jgi:hypothetical protein